MMLLLKKFGKAVGGLVKSVMDDSVSAYSAQAAFFMIISAFPMVMLMLTMLKYLPYFSDGVPIINIRFLPADLNLFVQGRGPHLPLRQELQGTSDFRLRSQGPCRLGTGESGLVLG